jgi:hypothetical protein
MDSIIPKNRLTLQKKRKIFNQEKHNRFTSFLKASLDGDEVKYFEVFFLILVYCQHFFKSETNNSRKFISH